MLDKIKFRALKGFMARTGGHPYATERAPPSIVNIITQSVFKCHFSIYKGITFFKFINRLLHPSSHNPKAEQKAVCSGMVALLVTAIRV
jgi:hypothetical protein